MNSTPTSGTQAALGYVLGVVIAILATLALVHWMSCSQEAGTALCMAMAVTPTRRSWPQRIGDWLYERYLRVDLRDERAALCNMEQSLADLPDLIEEQQQRIDYLREQLSAVTGTPAERL